MRVCAALTYVMVSVRRGGMEGGQWSRRGQWREEWWAHAAALQLFCTHSLSTLLLWCICAILSPLIYLHANVYARADKRKRNTQFSVVLQNPKADMQVLQIFIASLGAFLWMGIGVCTIYLHGCLRRQRRLSCEQAEPPPLRLVIGANPPTLSRDKADPHYPACVLIYVRNERGGVGSGDGGVDNGTRAHLLYKTEWSLWGLSALSQPAMNLWING